MTITSEKYPHWLKKKAPNPLVMVEMEALLKRLSLDTICQSALCPNQGECFAQRTATFLIMGNICTRNCRFCNVRKGQVSQLDSSEPGKVAEAVQILKLRHAVITSVTRDDLPDGGAIHFVKTITAIRQVSPQATIEILIPDFRGSSDSLQMVVDASPEVIGHNVETIPRLYNNVRPIADYKQSLALLAAIKTMNRKIITKSGLMLGLGEERNEVIEVMQDLHEVHCDILTIGQYLPPSHKHVPSARYVKPSEFEEFHGLALEMGFSAVASSPFVRSSFNAKRMYEIASTANLKGRSFEVSHT
jgi:lipoic acid synthetase